MNNEAQIFRRMRAMLLSAVMFFTPYTHSISYAAHTEGESLSLFQPTANEINRVNLHSSGEKVKIVVETEDSPLLAYSSLVSSFSSTKEFTESDEAKRLEINLMQKRDQVKKNMLGRGMDITVLHEYSTVMNGFSVEAYPGDLQGIKETEGVKNAFIARLHPLIEPIEYVPYMAGSIPAIGGDIVHENLGYTGKGTAIAILDTGLDIDHSAFSGVNNAKYTQSDIADILKNNRLTVGTLDVSVLYKKEKIPFAYDYADSDTNVSGGDSHGTHVAGIAAANSGGVITGVAPDAQLMVMKVFGDSSGGAYDSDILAALDDSIKLGADSINMSLGSPAGFATDADITISTAYERVVNAGVSLMCAVGNGYSATQNNTAGNDLPNAEHPDNGIAASPSTYSAAVSVASMNNLQTTAAYFLAEGNMIRYNDPAEEASKQLYSLDGTYDYVDCGVGSSSDFEKVNVRGKIALIQRGGEEDGEILTFLQKETYAREAGAIAAIIYDNVAGELVSMATDCRIPCVFISKTDGETMLALSDKTISISPELIHEFKDAYSGKMSDFSSWGVTPELKLKPEITAPGGDIYSALPNDLYGNMSGTSMATPHMAGAAAVMDQYIREERNGLSMTQTQRRELATALMMSSASPVRDSSDNLYSPRKQGAGLVQLQRAVKAGAYLTSNSGERPKAEMGYNEEGEFSFSFLANSLSQETINYEIDVTVLTEDHVVENGKAYMAQASRKLGSDEAEVTIARTLTLPANTNKSVPVTIKLTEVGRQNLDAIFPNGIYVEGYVTLTPVSGDDVPLSFVFMGFYGDWSSLPMFDSTIYDDTLADLYEMQLGQFDNYTGAGYILGNNRYVDDATDYDARKIAIKGKDKSRHITAITSLLRNAERLTFSAFDSAGDTVYSETIKQVQKTYHNGEGFYTPMAYKGWTPYDSWGTPLADGNYTYTVTGELEGKSQSITFPVVIDTVNPEVISSVVEGWQWKVTVRDNHYVQAMCAVGAGSSAITPLFEPNTASANSSTEVIFDLSQPAFEGLSEARLALIDYAGNEYYSDYYPLTSAVIVYPESISLNKSEQYMKVGEMAVLSSIVLPTNASNRAVTWSSDNSSIATVDGNGEITAHGVGRAVITATTVNGLSAACTIVVADEAQEGETVLISIKAPASVTEGSSLPYTLALEKMSRVATVSVSFEKDDSLVLVSATGRNGFSSLGVKWNGSDSGTVALSYLKDGAAGSVTVDSLTDVALLTFSTEAGEGSYGVNVIGVSVSGYDKDGNAVFMNSDIKEDNALITLVNRDAYDLNGDGNVDLLDITYCQKFYQHNEWSIEWNTAVACDLDNNGIVDVEDMILLLWNI